jgi:hypothetical protein
VPSATTEITEIVTGLATLGYDSIEAAIASRTAAIANVTSSHWDRLAQSLRDPANRLTFQAAWANGRAFARARDGLRGRTPVVVEWKGPHRAVGDESVPVDVRIDHVYLLSCKYLSRILYNLAPARLFEEAIAGPRSRSYGDWYLDVAPSPYQALYEAARAAAGPTADLPARVDELGPAHRRTLKQLDNEWHGRASVVYAELAEEVSAASAAHWTRTVGTPRQRQAMLWRLLRIGSAPYFILGTSRSESIRLRIATPWDWQQRYELRGFDIWPDPAGQPVVRWRAEVNDRHADSMRAVDGHVEIRWSHGRFAQPPEAKVYLDTSHRLVPGYIPLT